jgi:hypothetical protein
MPPECKRPLRRQPQLEPVKESIDTILQADQQAPRKQRQTAQRIWQRIGRNDPEPQFRLRRCGVMCGNSREELGQGARETFVPQVYEWGGEAQVDWYDAEVEVAGERRPVHIFAIVLDGQRRGLSCGLLSRHPAGPGPRGNSTK